MPGPTGGAYSTPQTPLLDFRGRGRESRRREGRMEGRGGEGKRGEKRKGGERKGRRRDGIAPIKRLVTGLQ